MDAALTAALARLDAFTDAALLPYDNADGTGTYFEDLALVTARLREQDRKLDEAACDLHIVRNVRDDYAARLREQAEEIAVLTTALEACREQRDA